jgi:hypothetical protein
MNVEPHFGSFWIDARLLQRLDSVLAAHARAAVEQLHGADASAGA